MIKKKRFGISNELARGFTETINIVENNESKYRNAVVPFSRIELDPNNPRTLTLKIVDLKNGILPDDPDKVRKLKELESIKELSQTISSAGLINPIVVFKRGDTYRVVAGERRCLASIWLGKTEIEAKVYNEKPSPFELKLIQWIENNSREDLTLLERINNIKDIQNEYQIEKDLEISNVELAKIAGISLPQAGYYIAVSKASKRILSLIEEGQISSLDKAYLITSAKSPELQDKLIQECLDGSNVKQMRIVLGESTTNPNIKKKGRTQTRINLGHAQSGAVIKIIVDAVVTNLNVKIDLYSDKVNWRDTKIATKIFRNMLSLLETNSGNKNI
jgi:ParB family chromosome partitioning protein